MPSRLANLRRITPQQLRAFEAVARLGSVTRAAIELHVTQPTVSVQLREITLAVGEPLFESVGRTLRITQTGELLQKYVMDIGHVWQSLEADLSEIRGLVSGRLRIAAVTTTEYFAPDLLGPFAAAHPGVDIELVIENRDRVVERLARGLDDLAVMMLPPTDASMASRPFLDNPLVVIARGDHPLARKRITLSRLAEARWLMREQGSGTRLVAEQHFAKRGFSPRVAMSLGSNEAIKHAVLAGFGLAVVSRLVVRSGMHGVKISEPSALNGLVELQVSGFPLRRSWQVVWRREKALSFAAQRFMSYLKSPSA